MKITPTMKRESRNSGYASPVFHLNKWPGWSDTPYHREGAGRIKRVTLPRGFEDVCENRLHFKVWLQDNRAFWESVAAQMKSGTYVAVNDGP